MRRVALKCVLGISVMTGSLCYAQYSDKQAAQPDNTKINQRDREKSQPTADQQKENESDREATRKIRRALVKDKSLSIYAHNVKIVAQNGTITLKGPVRSADEKQADFNKSDRPFPKAG